MRAKLVKPVAVLLGALALFVPAAVLSAATVEYDLTIARQEMNITACVIRVGDGVLDECAEGSWDLEGSRLQFSMNPLRHVLSVGYDTAERGTVVFETPHSPRTFIIQGRTETDFRGLEPVFGRSVRRVFSFDEYQGLFVVESPLMGNSHGGPRANPDQR